MAPVISPFLHCSTGKDSENTINAQMANASMTYLDPVEASGLAFACFCLFVPVVLA